MKVMIDGVEQELFTAEEVTAKTGEVLTAKEAEFKAREEELDALQNPNIKVLREKAKRLEALERSGKTIGEDGSVNDAPKPLGHEDIVAATRKELLDDRKNEYLDGFDKDKREVVEHYYNKLTTGEEVTSKNMRDFIAQAARLAEVDAPNENFNRYAAGRGGAPDASLNSKKEDFADTEAGKAWAGNMGIKI